MMLHSRSFVLLARPRPPMSEAAQVSSEVPAVLDVEASGFGAGSYPIEIGYIASDGTSYCTLIRPAPSWTHWDPGQKRCTASRVKP
jgi:hypothetical protein